MKADCGFAAEIDISLVPVYYTVAKPTRVRQRLMNISKVLFAALLAALSTACSHPLEPVGQGDILSLSNTRNCLLEDYQARLGNCDDNFIAGSNYTETYTAQPRAGWTFSHWENYCQNVVSNECSFDIPIEFVAQAAGLTVPPLRAIFAPLPFTPTLTESPEQFKDAGADFAANVSYGPFPRNIFDILMPPSEQPTPLIAFIHGGGFTGGWKSAAYTASLPRFVGQSALSNGVAYASIEYRLLATNGSEGTGVIKPMGDVRRALQYLRLHAESFNIDPNRIAVFGTSAGAGTSLWLGSHDDAANTRSTDPVERMTTRITAAGASATQATYDIVGWEDVFADFSITLALIALVQPNEVQRLLDFYAIASMQDLYDDPDTVAYRADVDMLALMDAQDAPIWVQNNQGNIGIPTNSNTLFHHGLHAQALRDRAIEVGLENVVYASGLGISDPSGEGLADFLLRQLGVTR